MRVVLIALGLIALGVAAGSAAVAMPYSWDSGGPCPNVGGYGEGPWQWWPVGRDCPDFASRPGAPSVAGSVAGSLGALLVLGLAWWRREDVAARAAFAMVLVLGFAGLHGASINAPFAMLVLTVVAGPIAFAVDRVLSARERRSLLAGVPAALAVYAGLVVAYVLVFLDLWPATAAGLVLGVVVAAASAAWLARVLPPPGPRVAS